MNSYRDVSEIVKDHILIYFDTHKEMIAQLENSQQHFTKLGKDNFGEEMAQDGFFLVYNDDVCKFVKSLPFATVDGKAPEYTPEEAWKIYKNLIGKEAQNILDESRRNLITELDTNHDLSKKTGYVQGVCESILAISNKDLTETTYINLSKQILSEMKVTKDMAKKYAHPETYKALEQTIFAPQQKLERSQSRGL